VLVVWELVALGLAGPRQRFPQTDPKGWWVGLVCVRCGVVCRHAEPCRCFICLAPPQRARRRRWRWRGRGVGDGRGVRVADAHHLSGCPFGGLGGQGGEAAFCLGSFCSSSAVPEPFLDFAQFLPIPSSLDFFLAFLASLEAINSVKWLRIICLVKANRVPQRGNRQPWHQMKRRSRDPVPFNVPMATIDGRGFRICGHWQQQR